MAHDMFLKLDGIKGESVDHKHADTIDVMSWSWGLSQTGTMHTSTGGGAGKVNVHDISFTHHVDTSTPALILHCSNGKHIKTGILTVRKAGGSPLEYLKIELEDVLVSSVTPGGSGGEDRISESVTLNFAKFKVTYQAQDKNGNAKGGPIAAGWDISANKAIG